MVKTIITSVLAFVSTNIDDIFILTLYFGNRNIKPRSVFVGQSLGLSTLVMISFIGALVENFIDQRFIGLLGLFPIYLALKHSFDLLGRKKHERDNDISVKSTGILAIAAVTIANGSDNIGVYVPLLATMDSGDRILLIIIFAIMTYAWCIFGRYLARRPIVAAQLDKYGYMLMPVVLFLLGAFILIESKTFNLLF